MIRPPSDIYGDPNLSKGARLLLVYLWRHIGDRQASGCWFSTIGKARLRTSLNVSRNALNRYIAELLATQWVRSVRQRQLYGPHTFELWAA